MDIQELPFMRNSFSHQNYTDNLLSNFTRFTNLCTIFHTSVQFLSFQIQHVKKTTFWLPF